MEAPNTPALPDGSAALGDGPAGSPSSQPRINFEREPGAASGPLPRTYQRRMPETTLLYAIIRDNLETFLDDAGARHESGAGYPRFIEQEFRRSTACSSTDCLCRGRTCNLCSGRCRRQRTRTFSA